MNSRERMLSAINRQPVDRIPTDIWATPEVFNRLTKHFGSVEAAMHELHIDGFGGIGPMPYIGPAPDDGCDYWGMKNRRIKYATGSYEVQVSWPLADAHSIDDLARYRWPSADWFDYAQIQEGARKAHETHAIQCGYMAPFFYHNLLRGLEQSLVDPYDDPEFTDYFLARLSDFFYEHHRRIFEACDGLIDVAQVTDDYGGQTGPLISLKAFRQFYKPHLQRFIDLCKSFGIKVFHHDDGAMSAFLPDLVEIGIDILNPVQWNCPGMDLDRLKSGFGNRICFHGAVENQSILPFGTPEEVRAEVRKNIDTLAADGTGYILASCHALQPVTPLENIIAMYDEAYRYGRVG